MRLLAHPLHEQIGNPMREVHVVGAAAIVAGVLAQLDEFLDVDVPGLEVRARRTLALAALIDGDCRVVRDLQEGNHALARTAGALDETSQTTNVRPVVAESTAPLREERVVANGFEDVAEVVLDRREEARRELRMDRA